MTDQFSDIVGKVAEYAFSSSKYPSVQNKKLPAEKEFQLWNVPEEQRSYSSTYVAPHYNQSMLFLEPGYGWLPKNYADKNNAKNNWLLLDLKKDYLINGVALQTGSPSYYLKKFKLKFWSENEKDAEEVDGGYEFTNPSAILGKTEYNKISFENPIKTRYLKLTPITYVCYPMVRIAVFKCDI